MSFYAGRQNYTPSAAPGRTVAHILASATVRCGLCEYVISSDATPNEYTGEYQICRTTSAGVGGSSGSTTVVKLNTFSPTAGCTFGGGGYVTTDPTVGDVLMDVSVHQKATFRWVAYPGREINSSPTASNGVALVNIQQSTAFSINAGVTWLE
jgi:hypothetical protein